MKLAVLVGKANPYLADIALTVLKPVGLLLAVIVYAVKGKGNSVRKGGFACSVVSCRTGYVAKGKGYGLSLIAEPAEIDFSNINSRYFLHLLIPFLSHWKVGHDKVSLTAF